MCVDVRCVCVLVHQTSLLIFEEVEQGPKRMNIANSYNKHMWALPHITQRNVNRHKGNINGTISCGCSLSSLFVSAVSLLGHIHFQRFAQHFYFFFITSHACWLVLYFLLWFTIHLSTHINKKSLSEKDSGLFDMRGENAFFLGLQRTIIQFKAMCVYQVIELEFN